MIRPIIGTNFNTSSLIKASNFKGSPRPSKNPERPISYANSTYYLPNKLNNYGSRARDILSDAIVRFEIDKNKIKTICDFGCGSGRPTTVLKEIFGPKCDVIGIDYTDRYFEPDKESTFKHCDGIEYLESGERKFDLITAQMLDPEVEVEAFIKATAKSVNEGGKLLIYSDYDTMSNLLDRIGMSGALRPDDWKTTKVSRAQARVHGNWPTTLLLEKEALDKLLAVPIW